MTDRSFYSPHGNVIEGSGATHTHMTSGIFWPLDEIPQQSLVHVASPAVPALARLREDVLHLEPDAQQTLVATPVFFATVDHKLAIVPWIPLNSSGQFIQLTAPQDVLLLSVEEEQLDVSAENRDVSDQDITEAYSCHNKKAWVSHNYVKVLH